MDATRPASGEAPPAKRRRLLLPLACLLILAGVAWGQRPDGRLHLFVLGVPGDAFLIQTPAGRFVLIDGGRDPAALTLQLGRHLPFWRHDLLAVLLTAADGQRLPGQVAALARYSPAFALAPPELSARGTAGEWRRLVADQAQAAGTLRAGQALRLDGATLRVLHASEGEAGGAVLLITYGRTQVLLHSGGAEGDEAAKGVKAPLDLLIYPWQRPLDTATLLALRPASIAFSQAHEAFAPALLSYAERRRFSPRLFHPANDGTIELVSDGRRVWFSPAIDK